MMLVGRRARPRDDGDADAARGAHRGGARRSPTRNVRALRDEIVDLGPYAFEELSFDTAVENCMPVWKRRYGFEVMATIQRIDLAPEVAG